MLSKPLLAKKAQFSFFHICTVAFYWKEGDMLALLGFKSVWHKLNFEMNHTLRIMTDLTSETMFNPDQSVLPLSRKNIAPSHQLLFK